MKKIYLLSILCIAVSVINAQWTNDKKINTLVANANASDIQTTNTDDGRTWVAFYSQHGTNYDMRAQLLDYNGNKLLGDSGALVSSKKSGSATFVFNVCADKDNNLIVAFQFEKNNSYECIIQKVSTSGNLLWGTGIDLGPGLSPYPATLTTNEIAVAWNDNNGKIEFQKISSSGNVAWNPAKIFTGNSNHIVSRAQVVAGINGRFAMVYQDQFSAPFYTNLYEQSFDNNGNNIWPSAVKISTLTTVSYRYYSVIADKDTTYVGYYGNPQGSNRFDAFVQKINPGGYLPWGANGSAFADYSQDNDPYEQTIYIAKQKGFYPRIWAACTLTNPFQTESGVYAQLFDVSTGSRYFGNYAKEIFPITTRMTSLAFSDIDVSTLSVIFLFTDNTNKLSLTKINMNGDFALPDTVKVVGATKNTKFRYGLTHVYYGQCVAVWQENKGNGDMPYAQDVKVTPGVTSLTDNIVSIKNIYPNPVQSILNLTINSSTQNKIQVYITDVSGNMIKQFSQTVQQGDNIIQLNVSNIKGGNYFIKVSGDNTGSSTLFTKD